MTNSGLNHFTRYKIRRLGHSILSIFDPVQNRAIIPLWYNKEQNYTE